MRTDGSQAQDHVLEGAQGVVGRLGLVVEGGVDHPAPGLPGIEAGQQRDVLVLVGPPGAEAEKG